MFVSERRSIKWPSVARWPLYFIADFCIIVNTLRTCDGIVGRCPLEIESKMSRKQIDFFYDKSFRGRQHEGLISVSHTEAGE